MKPQRPWLRWVLAVLALLLFILGFVLLKRFVDLDTTGSWVLGVTFVLLGLVTAGAILWYLRPASEKPATNADDALLVFKAAQQKLPGASITSRTVVLVIGPENATKTTLVARSTSANPELLAGAAPSAINEAPVPTRDLNLWLMQQAVIAEIGGALMQDEKRWLTAVRAFRAPRLGAAFKSDVVAPRAVVVCVPCDLFAADGNGDSVVAEAKLLRERLTDVSRELGMRVPAYVVFTRLDRIPHFEAWAATFTREEVRPPLGVALPFDTESDAASYADRTAKRIGTAMSQLVASIASRRVEMLGREASGERRFEAYEFPRELKKRGAAMTRFMVELCRPTQLAASPLLRGFYFTGARPVVISDVRQASQQPQRVEAVSADATAIFRQHAAAPAHASAGGAAGSTTRKVPEWVFLDQFFRDVVLADPGAASSARSGVRVQRTRRALVATAIAASVALLVGVSVSWARNSGLQSRVRAAAQSVHETRVSDDAAGALVIPSTDALERLERLRAYLDTVRTLDEDRPFTMGFMLWRGQPLLQDARTVWYEGFRRQLFASSMRTLRDSLSALRLRPVPPRPTDDYGAPYSWLKAYLLNTSETERNEAAFLAPVMLTAWQQGRTIDPDVNTIASNQFTYFASELPTTNYFGLSADEGLVTQSRAYLNQFDPSERLYHALITDAEAKATAVDIPQREGVLRAPQQVSGAFSRAGAAFVDGALLDSARFSGGEQWVLGDVTTTASVDRLQLVDQLRRRYQSDYIAKWQEVLKNTSVVSPSGLADATAKLNELGGPQSPLMKVLAVTAQNTLVPFARDVFQPVHVTADTTPTAEAVIESNKQYMSGLRGLGSAIQGISLIEGSDTAAVTMRKQKAIAVIDDASRAANAAGDVVSSFKTTRDVETVGPQVQRLLLEPIRGAQQLLQRASRETPRAVAVRPAGGGGAPAPPPVNAVARALNEAGAALCNSFGPTLSKFPFNPSSPNDASMDEVQRLLVRQYGALWQFHAKVPEGMLTRPGNDWVAKPSGGAEMTPEFVEFFNNAARVSEALFPRGAADARFTVRVRGLFDKDINGMRFAHGAQNTALSGEGHDLAVDWPPARANNARLSASFRKNKRDNVVDSASGTWALFRLIAKSSYVPADANGIATWANHGIKDGVPVRLEIKHVNGVPVLQPGWMGNALRCVSTVAK